MEHLSIVLDNDEQFDATVHAKDALPQVADLRIITKAKATVGGKPGAVIAFTVQLPDGTMATAQAVTTVATLKMLGAALNGRYPD